MKRNAKLALMYIGLCLAVIVYSVATNGLDHWTTYWSASVSILAGLLAIGTSAYEAGGIRPAFALARAEAKLLWSRRQLKKADKKLIYDRTGQQ